MNILIQIYEIQNEIQNEILNIKMPLTFPTATSDTISVLRDLLRLTPLKIASSPLEIGLPLKLTIERGTFGILNNCPIPRPPVQSIEQYSKCSCYKFIIVLFCEHKTYLIPAGLYL